MSLVDVVDEVLDQLDADEELRFTLDGQLATVDDYLEIRPEAEERIRAFVQAGRLAIGPWQTLVDEFLVDGETTLRNLEAGLARAAEFGSAMRVGYLPDMFGHVAQMPQILRLAGLEAAVVWRGVPAAVDFHRFVWEGQDGSSVVAEYLPAGYGNAAHLFDGAGEPAIQGFEERMRPWFGEDEILGMVGTDHMPLVRDLPSRLPAGSRLGTIGGYLESAAPDGLTTWYGEMRSAARANLLPGVVSARIDLKAACTRAESWLERYAEPLQALYGGRGWPEQFLRQAWTRMFQNAAHDSICGCSADEVSAQVLVRYAEAEQIGRGLAQRALDRIAAECPTGSHVVVNLSPRERADLVALDVVVPEEWDDLAFELPDGSQVPAQEVRREDGAKRTVAAAIAAPPLGWTSVRTVRGGSDPPSDWAPIPDTNVAALTRIVRGKDVGDSYNYAPPEDDVLTDEPVEQQLEILESGPLRRVEILHRTYVWDGRRVETQTRAEQRATERFVRFRIDFHNPCDDQRVRVHVPLREPADRSFAEGQFAVVERGQEVESGHGEVPIPTFPASAFVVAGGIAGLLEHVTEYELVGEELALTILRSTGLISRTDHPWREEPAGPSLPIPAAQLLGPRSFSFAYLPSADAVHEQAEQYRYPFLTAHGKGPAGALRTHAGPALEGDACVLLTSLQPGGARIVNESADLQAVVFAGQQLELRPWEIRNVSL
jgi:Glycosyl hydrolases family 38 N-terminal domain/Alpha mannosidase middle domain/Glycosyl hydrolases family 38 C-terminal domain